MRKLLAAVTLLMVCLLLPVMASADSLYEWNRSCRRKMSSTTTVYSGGDVMRVTDTIPAGTYVKVLSQVETRAWINYMKSDGVLRHGFVDPKCIGSAVIVFTDADGDRHGIQELQYYEMYGNNPPPGGVLDKPLPGGNGETVGKPITGDATDTTGSTTSTGTNKASSKSKSTKKTETVQTPAHDILWQNEKVQVRTLGAINSVIVADGEEQTIPTSELTFSEKVAEDKRLASILAPRTGRCYLRAKASSKGTVIDKCPAGTVVQVIKYGKSYCQIVFEGQVGYVQTACLTFLDPAAAILGTTVLTYNGRATGAAQVPIRNTASNDSCIVVKLRSGTEVTVLAHTGKWYEVAYEGLHGFVHESFMDAEIR